MTEKRSRAAAIFFMASVISVYFFVNFQKAVLVPIFNEMQGDFGVSAGAVTGITTTFFLVYAAMQIATGLLVDRYGGGRVLIFGSLLMVTGSVLFPLSRWLWMAYLARVLTGIGAGSIYLCAVKEIDRLFPGSFTKVLGITMLVGYCGTAFAGPPLIWAVNHFRNWRIAVACFDAPLVLATTVLVALSIRQEKPPIDRRVKLLSLEPYKQAFRNRNLRLMLGASPFMYASFIMLQNTIIKKMIEDVGRFSAHAAGIVFTVMVILSAVFQMVPGALEDLVHRRRKMLLMIQISNAWLGVALIGAGVVVAGYCGATATVKVLMSAGLFMLAAAAGSTPLTTSIFREVSDPKKIGTSLSLSNCLVYLLSSLAGQAAGFLMDKVGGADIAITTVAGKAVKQYPTRSYLAVMIMLLLMVTFSFWNGSRVPETNGKNIYKPEQD